MSRRQTFFRSIFLFLVVLGLGLSASGQIKVTTTTGAWSDPAIWSPVGVPTLADTLIEIHHNVSVGNQLTLTNQHLYVVTGNTLDFGTNSLTLTNGQVEVEGTLELHVMDIWDGVVSCTGQILVSSAISFDGALLQNAGRIETPKMSLTTYCLNKSSGIFLAPSITNDGKIMNDGYIESTSIFSNDGEIVQNGDWYVDFWSSDGLVHGAGSFCIDGISINNGTISGSLDICDNSLTGSGPVDVNNGTIAGTVTSCLGGSPCSPLLGEKEVAGLAKAKVFPNPMGETLRLNIPTEWLRTGNLKLTLLDAQGRIVKAMAVKEDALSWSMGELSAGFYLLRVWGEGRILQTDKLLKK